MLTKSGKHENYEILNLIGYGLAKFNRDFIAHFNASSKQEFYQYLVQIGVAETVGTIKNRQDLFDPFFENGRQGWHQKGNAYIHRKHLIDALFGNLGCKEYAQVVQIYLKNEFGQNYASVEVSPILSSKFKQLQKTGLEAELFFKECYRNIPEFVGGQLEDARFFGDGYDFQITVNFKSFLAEVKGVRSEMGSIRLTSKEYQQANRYRQDYAIVVVSSLDSSPKMTPIFDPISTIQLEERAIETSQIYYGSPVLRW
jgi:hypothetical protein